MFGGGPDRPRKQAGPVDALITGVLDFELDIGVVNDVDIDPIRQPSTAPIVDPSEREKLLSDTAPFENEPSFWLDRENWLSIQGTEFGQNLFVGSKRLALPEKWKNPDFPFVRGLHDGSILVTDTSFEIGNAENTWILNREGKILAHFASGSAAVEISPLGGGLIAVGYHPLSAVRFGYRVEPQQRTAIAFFDEQGKLLTTFNHEAGRSGVAAENVRCMTRLSPHELLFVPETATLHGQSVENPVIFYNCATSRTMLFSSPFGGAEACSAAHNRNGDLWILLASPEGFEDQLIGFDPVRKVSQYLGAFTGIFRGLASTGTESGASAEMAGFLAQELASEYQWVLPNSDALPLATLSNEDADERPSPSV